MVGVDRRTQSVNDPVKFATWVESQSIRRSGLKARVGLLIAGLFSSMHPFTISRLEIFRRICAGPTRNQWLHRWLLPVEATLGVEGQGATAN